MMDEISILRETFDPDVAPSAAWPPGVTRPVFPLRQKKRASAP